MPRSYWLPIVAVVGLILSVHVQANAVHHGGPPVAQREAAPEQEASGAQNTPAKTPDGTSSRPLYVEAKCEHGCGYSEDNKGVWEKVRTDPVAMFTAMLALFTLGLIYVGWRQATWIKRTVDDSNRQHVISNRAFVFLENIEETSATAFRDHHSAATLVDVKVVPRWKNSGDTPTRNLVIQINSRLIVGDLPKGFEYDYTGTPFRTMIGPKANEWNSPVEFSNDDADTALNGRGHLYIWGRADYEDIFDGTPKRFTEFCLRAQISSDGREITIRWVSYGNHNRSDADHKPNQNSVSLLEAFSA
jgi:hypothetical protein